MHQICSQLDQVLQLLQNNLVSSISSNIEPISKREGKKHTKAITLRFKVVVKEPIRSNCREKEVGEKQESILTPSARDGALEK